MNNGLKIGVIANLIKALFGALSILHLASCVTTNEARESKGLVDINTQLTALLTQADVDNDREAKPALANFAITAHAKADELAAQQQAKLALGFYQAASQAYWRDDIAANNTAIFEIAENVEQLCTQLGDQAPDRDCFVSPLIEHFASVDMITFNPEMILTGTDITEANAARSRSLLKELGDKKSEQVGFENGALTNLINHAAANQAILSNHPELNTYVCNNLVTVFGKYAFALLKLEDYYNNENETLAASEQVNIENEHPLFLAYNQFVDLQNTLPLRAENFIKMQIPSCAS